MHVTFVLLVENEGDLKMDSVYDATLCMCMRVCVCVAYTYSRWDDKMLPSETKTVSR